MVQRLRGFLSILRPINSVMMGVAVLVGQAIASPTAPSLTSTPLPFATAFMLTAASMVLNDYFDVESDKANQPNRPIPSGVISQKEALWFSVILATLGLVAAAFTNTASLIVASLFFALAAFYNAEGKRWGFWGNLMVSATVAAPFIYGAFSLGQLPTLLLMLFAALAFLANTGREVMKGIADVEGDRLRGVKTIALASGVKRAAMVAGAFYFAAVAVSPAPILLSLASGLYIPPVAAADVGFVFSAAIVMNNPAGASARRMKNLSLIWMLLGLVGFTAGARVVL
ncbi:MAG: UbiA family prenyltransferase [Candidatus Bathyarchaeia archaeon]